MSKARRTLFSLALVLTGGACDPAADDPGQPGATLGDAASTATSPSASTDSTESSAASGSGGSSSTAATLTNGATNSVTSAALSTGTGETSAGGAASTSDAATAGSGGTSANSTGGSAAGGGGGQDTSACDDAGLVWKSGKKTNYTSYPDPGSEECVVYNGCMWSGWFAHCDEQQSEAWVAAHDIAAMFPDSGYELHDICLRSGDRTMIVTIYDTCGDDDCDGCCTENKGDADALIDLESFTNERWGLPDGDVEWADLGPTTTDACE